MPQLENIRVQFTGQSMSGLVRELNRKLDSVRAASNLNFLYSYPQVDAMVDSNADVTIWVAQGQYEIDRWAVYVDDVTTNPTINLRVDGSTKDTQTPSAVQVYEYELSSVEPIPRLGRVSLNVTNLFAGATITASIGLRRLT